MRIAINCLALPVTGRPTRRARRNCSSVASGISERFNALSGICLALFAGCLARADDAYRFFFILEPPDRVNQREYISVYTLIAGLRQAARGLTGRCGARGRAR